MQFRVKTTAPRWLLGVIAMHGLTDARDPRLLWPYALLGAPLPGALVTAAFFLASVGHFAADMRVQWSLLLHALLAATARVSGSGAAFELLVAYIAAVHLPQHFASVLSEKSFAASATSALALASGVAAGRLLDRHAQQNTLSITITHFSQKLVLSHALTCEFKRYIGPV